MIRILLGVLLLAPIGGAHAARTMEYVEGAYELTLADEEPNTKEERPSLRPAGPLIEGKRPGAMF